TSGYLLVRTMSDECILRVRDTGTGIAPELLPRIFDLFTQSEQSLVPSQGGLGIGLALVRRLVQMHQGRVEAHSTLGQGSEFVVTLPVASSSVRPLPNAKRCRCVLSSEPCERGPTMAWSNVRSS